MLSRKTIDIIKYTTPILQKHKIILTKKFYERMFSQHPEMTFYFNTSSQKDIRQSMLTEVLYDYAKNIDNLEKLNKTFSLIANQHASLMIQSKHYSIIGKHFLASVKEFLKKKATTNIMDAWSEAYSFLANILIIKEKEIYNNNAGKKGGWRGFRSFIVKKKERESSNITSFYLVPEDCGDLPYYKPGQYVTVYINSHKTPTMHHYSLSEKPGKNYFRISIKEEKKLDIEEGNHNTSGSHNFLSHKIYHSANVGDVLKISPPCGDFFLDIHNCRKRPLVLLGAGIGIAPILSILNSAMDIFPKCDITFIYGCTNEKVQPFKKVIDSLCFTHEKIKIYYRYSNPINKNIQHKTNCSIGLIDRKFMESFICHYDSDYYFCGPKNFMINIYKNLLEWKIPKNQIHFEFFGSREELCIKT